MNHTEQFDRWIRGPFVAMNTELEELYFAAENRMDPTGIGDPIKAQIRDEGRALILPLLDEGKTNDGFANAFDLLGNVGFYMGALRRHELTNPDKEERSPFPEASALALHIGVSIGMVPRFATAHLATHNLAIDGKRKSFTALEDEFVFIDENTRAIISYQRAADALIRIAPLGISSPVTDVLWEDAKGALRNVIEYNRRLFDTLDTARFFFCVRPYYKPFRVGRQTFRGSNAGDFAGINELDLLLGLTRASDPYYSQLLHEKLPFMMPDEQARLRAVMSRRSLLDEWLIAAESHASQPWFRTNLRHYLEVCELFAETARQHHHQLVSRFIGQPSARLPEGSLKGITASGPPLPVMLRSLQILHDLRCAEPSELTATAHAEFARLRALAG
ncbi:MAG: DUF1864 family protein [Proteobacteria bacterium]|nr:DUF1864 family protein [Pseudomonadota bacterium]